MGSNESKMAGLLWPLGFSLAVGAGVWWFLHSRLQANDRPDTISDDIDDTRNPNPTRKCSLTQETFEAMLKRARAQLLPMVIFINKSNGGSKAQKILSSRKAAEALERLPENTVFFATSVDDEAGKMLLRRLMIANRSQSLESMLPVALFVNLGLFVRANIKGTKEFCQSIQQVKMIWARQRSLSGTESVQSAHLKQIDDLLDFAAREKVAKLIQRGVINREDVVFEGNDRNPAASAARAATNAPTRDPPPFKTEAMQEAEAIAAVERQILKDIQESEYQAALAADKKKEEEQREAEEAEARVLAEQQRAEEEAEAHAVWSAMAKKHALETLPPEPPADEDALCLVVCMVGSGRRLKRRWRLDDTMQHLFQFVFGHATDDEDVGQVGQFALLTNFPTRRFEDASATLRSTALQNNTVLRVVRTEGDGPSD